MEKVAAKQKRVAEALPAIAKCVAGKAIMVGGTALALFYLHHRSSIDIDLAVEKGAAGLCQELKGCISKAGFKTQRTTYQNVFVVNFQDTAIRVEVLEPHAEVKFKEFNLGSASLKVATLQSLFQLKVMAYKERRLYRDLFDLWAIAKHEGTPIDAIKKLIKKHGRPLDDIYDLNAMNIHKEALDEFLGVIKSVA